LLKYKDLVGTILIYNPSLMFVIPLFAIACDWTEALILLHYGSDRASFKKYARLVKIIFLVVSIVTGMAMQISVIAQCLQYQYNFWDVLNLSSKKVISWTNFTLASALIIFVAIVTIQYIVLFFLIMRVFRTIYSNAKSIAESNAKASLISTENKENQTQTPIASTTMDNNMESKDLTPMHSNRNTKPLAVSADPSSMAADYLMRD
jgi:hypothetical protein